MSEIRYVNPTNIGWLEYELDSNQIDYVWERIKDIESSNISHKPKLVGDIHESKLLEDPDSWFFNNILLKCCMTYKDVYQNMGDNIPISNKTGGYPYYMREWWVNYQQQTEFNPVHSHTGVYSFVIWLKIPTDYKEQNKDNTSNTKLRSSFQFTYSDLLGKMRQHSYKLDKSWEGTMLFFPSQLHHQVYPFFNCDEDRISISGNILCKV